MGARVAQRERGKRRGLSDLPSEGNPCVRGGWGSTAPVPRLAGDPPGEGAGALGARSGRGMAAWDRRGERGRAERKPPLGEIIFSLVCFYCKRVTAAGQGYFKLGFDILLSCVLWFLVSLPPEPSLCGGGGRGGSPSGKIRPDKNITVCRDSFSARRIQTDCKLVGIHAETVLGLKVNMQRDDGLRLSQPSKLCPWKHVNDGQYGTALKAYSKNNA